MIGSIQDVEFWCDQGLGPMSWVVELDLRFGANRRFVRFLVWVCFYVV